MEKREFATSDTTLGIAKVQHSSFHNFDEAVCQPSEEVRRGGVGRGTWWYVGTVSFRYRQ